MPALVTMNISGENKYVWKDETGKNTESRT